MFGMVIDVSAMLVATMTFRVSLGGFQNTLSCSEFGRDPYIASGISLPIVSDTYKYFVLID